MSVSAGEIDDMGFYIGPTKNGVQAEVTVDGIKSEKKFKLFSQAVKWVEQKRKKKVEENEIERSKEENA